MLGGAVPCKIKLAEDDEDELLNLQRISQNTTSIVNGTVEDVDMLQVTDIHCKEDTTWDSYESLQYSLFSNSGVEIFGGLLFLLTAVFIVRDKLACEAAVSGDFHI